MVVIFEITFLGPTTYFSGISIDFLAKFLLFKER
jgi:hypothetical protein